MAAALKSKQGLKDYLLLLSSLGSLDARSQEALLQRCCAGDASAVRAVVEAYLPKVLQWVSPRRGEALSFQELIAIGNCALIETVKAYRGSSASFEAKACKNVHDALDTALKMS
jgi:DNA-directed RNA polymerase sigma subunit (sigma70/sigma32)